MRIVLVAAAALLACGESEIPIPPECNGAGELCPRRFDEVVYPTTHNAMSNAEDGWQNPNQNRSLAHQLEDGVRGLMLDAHEYKDGVYLCHAFCQLGNLPLADGLRTIHDFLRSHRGEVVTIIFESYITAEAMETAFAESGLDRYVYAQKAGEPWPTLRELIDADERVVVLTDKDGGALPWYMDVWAQAFETHYQATMPSELNCAPNRGAPGNPLFILNHFITNGWGDADQAIVVNANPFLLERAHECMQANASLPNFVTVDFHDQGDVLAAVRALNGLP